MSSRNQTIRFLRALVKHKRARRVLGAQEFMVDSAQRVALAETKIEALASSGVLQQRDGIVVPTTETIAWIKRHLSSGEAPFAEQHQQLVLGADGKAQNAAEGPLARLTSGSRISWGRTTRKQASAFDAFLNGRHCEAALLCPMRTSMWRMVVKGAQRPWICLT